MPTTRTLANLRRRLAAAELELLRQVVTDQAARIEALEAELDRVTQRFHTAVDTAEQWRENYMDLQEQILNEHPAYQPGLTRSGDLVLIPSQSTH